MKYSDLISFDPLETVIQLKDSNDEQKARDLIKTFVMSEDLAKRYSDIVIQQIQFEQPVDNKGILIVGNYGSGKSHLMSVISSIAEYTGIFTELQNEDAKEQSKKINGKFKVLRIEIGSVTTPLRDIICSEIEKFLQGEGIDFKFESASKLTNNKFELERMMSEYEPKFPDQGLLLVVDEMLDYLKGRDEQSLFSDFNFLREVAEFCKSSRFRFIAGLQQDLFSNPGFRNAADLLKKFKDRFEQITIVRGDLDYVVKNRLLKKTDAQKGEITNHLDKFKKQFSILSNNFQDFVDLFPINPAYTEILDGLTFIEKRHVLKNISIEINKIFQNEVPTDEPGIISFDSYWKTIANDPVNLSDENITKTMKASKILETKVSSSLEPTYKDIGLRIIRGLSVYRLVTGDITLKIGLKAEELKDKLLLFDKGSNQQTSSFLTTTIDSILGKIVKITDGSYISQNETSLEWYIDVDKTVNYEEKISQQASILADDKKDGYFSDALKQAMEIEIATHVSGLKIWPYEIIWTDHNSTRDGYLFFGTPNERDTAQPPRQFYLYFIPFFKDPKFVDEKKNDEVFFKFKNLSDDTVDIIKNYAGARDLELTNPQPAKQVYRKHAESELKKLVAAIKQECGDTLQVTYQGESKPLSQIPIYLKGIHNDPFVEIIKSVASEHLKDSFDEKFPEYPTFDELVTKANISEYFMDTIKKIVTGIPPAKSGRNLLSGLKLLDVNGNIDPTNSAYAKWFGNQLDAKGPNVVLNRDDILETRYGEELDRHFHIEAEMVVIVLASMVYTGDIELTYPSGKINAGNALDMKEMKYTELLQFSSLSKVKGLPVNELVALYTLLNLQTGNVKSEKTLEVAVKDLQNKITSLLNAIVTSRERLNDGAICFGKPIFDPTNRGKKIESLDKLKVFCDSLQKYDSAGRLKNFKMKKDEIDAQKQNLEEFVIIERITGMINELQPLTEYITTGQALFSQNDDLFKKINTAKEQTVYSIQKHRSSSEDIKKPLQKLKDEYIQEYYELHGKVRLDSVQDTKKLKLINSKKYKKLIQLREKISFLDFGNFTKLEAKLDELKLCPDLTKELLQAEPKCKCDFDPSKERDISSEHVLLDIDDKLDKIEDDLTSSLHSAMEAAEVKAAIQILSSEEKKSIEDFLNGEPLPDEIGDDFIQVIQRVLAGLESAIISLDELKSALQEGGLPCTYEELFDRFKKILNEKSRKKGIEKTRFKIE